MMASYGMLALYAFLEPKEERRGWPWLLRATVGYAPFAVLVFAAMWTGQKLEASNDFAELFFGIVLGQIVLCPAISVGTGWIIWHIPPLRRGVEAFWLFTFDKQRELFHFDTGQVMVAWAILGLIFAFIVRMNIDFPVPEDYNPPLR